LEEKEIATTTSRSRVSSGYGRLDEVLKGGFLAGTAIVLSAPASDEVPLLIGNFLKASKEQALLICRTISSAQTITQNKGENVQSLVCSDKPVSPTRNIIPGKGIENLTDVNLQIGEAIASAQPKRLVIDILSDILLRHKALQTRKWLTELLERLRSKDITTLTVLNPYMHSVEDVQAIVDLFDGNIEMFEKESAGEIRKYLRIKWMHGTETTEKEFPLEGLAPERKGTRDRRQDVPGAGLDKRRIAILPFTNLSSNPEDGYFADGMTEELIDRLAQVKSLKIIARTSVMTYKKQEKKISEIARELEVGTLIEGSVRKAGNRVRVTVQLINAGTEEHLWSSHYDNNLDDIFAVQSEIAEKVAGELKTQLLDSEKQTLEKKPTENTAAYSFFLRGRELLREETEILVRQALSLFEKAIELDPNFARAYVGVADCHQWLDGSGCEPDDIALPIVKASLARAIDLDPNLPEAHASFCAMLFNVDDDLRSEAEARRALELNSSLPDPHNMLGELAALKGDQEEMVRQIETAYRLDPIRPHFIWLLGMAYLWTGREEEALEHWKKTEHLAPAGTYRGMVEYHLIKGDIDKAKEFYAKAEKLEPTRPWLIWVGGVIAALEYDRERAFLAIKKIEDAKVGPVCLNYIGYIYHALGDLDSYFEYMNNALEIHALVTLPPMYSPLFARARSDPRYLKLVEKARRQGGLTN
jgi:TolB-like protein